ncbi:YopX family protein [Cytobacillus kochii]|nr:YopX family protein [Cytobacillus kochii]MCA1029398.1 YopX family protein [Cytobacillus kochii]
MREIKFDAIYKPTGEHFTPISINFNDNSIVGNFDGVQGDWCHFSLDGKYGDVILRQYTGLKDKNGKEIYEGDVVTGVNRIFEGEILQDVNFLNGCFMFGNWNAHEFFNNHQFIEVIGNIYENPELINS